MRPVDGVAQQRDQPGARDRVEDPSVGLRVVQVEGGGLAAELVIAGLGEEAGVVVAAPHVLGEGLGVAGAAPRRRRPVGQEVLGLLGPRHPDLRVPRKSDVQRGGSRLRGSGDEEVGEPHARVPSAATSTVRKSWAPSSRVTST